MKKKIGVLLGVLAVLAILGGTGYHFRAEIMGIIPFFQDGSSQDKVYVEKVSRIMNQYSGVSNRFNGIVESQDIYEVRVDSSRTVGEIEVEVGDVVEEGQVLLSYDTSDLKVQVQQANLEIESINHEIENYNQQIASLTEESEKVPEDERFTFTTQIQNLQNTISQRQYDVQSKRLEISKYQTQISNSTLESTVSGIVREINENGMDSNGNSAPFMTIQQEGEYRIKGSIDEQNIWTLSEGQPVVIRSRIDAALVWNGEISLIDTENPESNNQNYYYSSSDSIMSSKYPFYIELDRTTGLILGQHVYIELDVGQEEEKEGLWIYGSYIVQDEEIPYVWAANDRNRLEKRYLELGDYDADMDEYQVLSGLEMDDYITWPMQGLYEGVTTVTDESEVDYSAPLYNQEMDDMGGEELFYDEMYDMEGFDEDFYDVDSADGFYDEGEGGMESVFPEETTEMSDMEDEP